MGQTESTLKPVAVNYHFSRKCNYSCGFCFHTAKSSDKLPLDQAKAVILQLSQAGCKKLNFAGGEPFLPDHTGRDNYLGEMVKYAKVECGFESVSIISNARFIKEDWMREYGQYLDMLGVSCDSALETTNKDIGRGKGDHTEHVKRAALLCHKYKIMFKLNTVVNSFNLEEDMSELVNEIKPMRWKIFQVLGVEGENNGVGAKRDVGEFLISKEHFDAYVARHRHTVHNAEQIMKVEDNGTMRSSYVLVDEKGRFLDCSEGRKAPTRPILEVGVEAAWKELTSSSGGGFDVQAFERRDGRFDWTNRRETAGGCGSGAGGGVMDIEDMGA